MFFWLAYCMALGFFIFYVPVFSFLFLFPFISNHNLSELNERYEYRIPQNARGRGGNLRALDHFWREEGRDGVGRQREREATKLYHIIWESAALLA